MRPDNDVKINAPSPDRTAILETAGEIAWKHGQGRSDGHEPRLLPYQCEHGLLQQSKTDFVPSNAEEDAL